MPYSILSYRSLKFKTMKQIISYEGKQYNGVPLRNSFIRRLVLNKTRIETRSKHCHPNILTERQ